MVRISSRRVEVGVDERLRQSVHQFRIGGRIGHSHVVFGFDQTTTHEMFPVTVDQRLGKELVFLGGDPFGERQTGIAGVADFRFGSASKPVGFTAWPVRGFGADAEATRETNVTSPVGVFRDTFAKNANMPA